VNSEGNLADSRFAQKISKISGVGLVSIIGPGHAGGDSDDRQSDQSNVDGGDGLRARATDAAGNLSPYSNAVSGTTLPF